MSVSLKDLIGILPTAEDSTKLRISFVGSGSDPDIININSPVIKYISDYTVKRIQLKRADREIDVTLDNPEEIVNALAEDAETPAPSTLIGSIEEAEEEADADPDPQPAPEDKPNMSARAANIVEMHKAGKTYKEIAAETGISYGTVWAICNKAKKGEKV